ncbi:glycoside hydrolase family 127 protein [Dyella sp. BiH032]|uniref:glycoside hydrolase family 127 protein n=1 Tax=Dyella sp. BiH032 TaxID=3075430 RepID=UPI0028932D65|nr:beta-L-arabinofuranosidase domain-containing protein [Dyella sp. BiH032]WNL46399.1 glycoside hydrolase family 127 protein [Dyella sp. BiH032]
MSANVQFEALAPASVRLDGPLGEALAANARGRLSHFVEDERSPAIALFAPERRAGNTEGDWYGEHAGKWLYAAAKAAARTRGETLLSRVRRVADYLASVQEPDGYLGTYAPERRFMRPQPSKPASWNGEPSVRTWDIWTHAYLILGLLEAHRHFPQTRWLAAARAIGDLCWRTLTDGGIDITELGNHFGLSATVLLDPAMELYFATGEARYLALAKLVLDQANAHRDLALLPRIEAGADAAEIATGKAYQLAWNLVGLAKLYKATGETVYRDALHRMWDSIRTHHLTLGGGPWGGVMHRSREVFNAPHTFSPYGYVETCSSLAWMQLNRELLLIEGDPRYAEEIERTAYNDLLGAQAPDGEDWCYYVFPNGRRVHTTYWRCCKSSGAMALEELPGVAYLRDARGLAVNLYGAGSVTFTWPDAGEVTLEQRTGYPFAGGVLLRLRVQQPARFVLKLRIPSWAEGASVRVGGEDVPAVPRRYVAIEREWQDGDEIALHFPMAVRLHRAVNRNVQESRAPDGEPVRQQVLRFDYVGLTRGPLVYATELIDGFKIEETLRLPSADPTDWLTVLPPDEGDAAPRIEVRPGYRAPLYFEPYYRVGGRMDGAWRLTWLQLAPEPPW